MIRKFFIGCVNCLEKSQCNLHQVGSVIQFECFTCGKTEVLVLDAREKLTKAKAKLIIERDIVEQELKKN